MRKRWLIALLLTFPLAGCSGEGAAGDTGEAVEAESNEETVVQENYDSDEEHQNETMADEESDSADGLEEADAVEAEVVAGATASELFPPGEQVAYQFDQEGTYVINCDPHTRMEMIVTVKEGSEVSGTVESEIVDFQFGEDITVSPGTIVIWKNESEVRHNVVISPS